MAYNLQSLMTILEQILNPQQTRWILDHNKPHLESLLQKAASMQLILVKSSPQVIQSFESQIRDAAHKAEDIIESYMVDQMLSSPEGAVSFTFSTPDLQQVMQELDSVKEQVVKLMDGNKMSSGSSWSGASFSSSKSIVVGLDADVMQLKDRLVGTKSKLEIIPIVGMGGVGKTTLARNLFEDPLIVSRFKTLAWTTISQEYNMKAILSCLLRCIIGKEFDDQHIRKGNDELRDVLYKSLYGKRYMIVLDDIWNTQFWDEINKYFPDNNNGSRIMITTRESEVAKYADSKSLQHQVQLLSKPESWNLLRQIVFGEDDCVDAILQGIGEKIASDCGGLPLAINVIGGLLSKVDRAQNVWENIANDVRAAIVESDKRFSQILSLSYDHLPNHLKPCFLYLGAFPEDYEIKASKLICMYVAEGFLKSSGDKSLEEEAEYCLKALVERNLLFVTRRKLNGKPASYNIHDMLRDLCMRKADEEKFLHIVKNVSEATSSNMRRVSVHTSDGLDDGCASAELMPLARSFLGIHEFLHAHEILSPVFFTLRLVSVLDIIEIAFQEFPREILQLVGLRFLALSCSSLPIGISKLCNLQTLIASLGSGQVPSELWEMSELRNIMINRSIWIDDEYMKRFDQKKLQRIYLVRLTPSLIERGFFENIPNIRNFGILYDDFFSSTLATALDLSHLRELETLRCRSRFSTTCCCYLPTLKFPCGLRKLSLHGCAIFPTVCATLSALPKLEVLKISECVFKSEENHGEWDAAMRDELSLVQLQVQNMIDNREWWVGTLESSSEVSQFALQCFQQSQRGKLFESEEPYREWEVAEGDEFTSLRSLKLERLDLVRWRADETNFPRLRQLVIKECPLLEGIPSAFGEITTLQIIELQDSSASAEASAKQIQDVQQSELGDYSLQLRIIHTPSESDYHDRV